MTVHFSRQAYRQNLPVACPGYSNYFLQIDCCDHFYSADNNSGKDFSQSARAGDCSFEDITEGLKKMRKHTILAKAASVAVCFGILLSNTASAFEGGPAPVARDVELTGDGTLRGQIYTSEGHVVENATVELRYQGTTVARAVTGANGDFAVTGVRGGAHDLSVGAATTSVRLWKNGTAPAGSVDNLVVAGDESVVRGQAVDEYGNPCNTCPPPSSGFGLIDVVTLTMLATSVAALVYAIDTNNEVDDLKAQLASP